MRVENLIEDQSILIALKQFICSYTHLMHLHRIAFGDLKSEAKWRKSFALGLCLSWNGEISSYLFLYCSLFQD